MNVGRNELILIGAVVLAVALLVLVPYLWSSGKADKREQCRQQVEAIRQAEIQYQEAFGDFVGAEAAPRAPTEVGPEPVPWAATEGFRRLSWAPDVEEVYGSYQVAVTRDDFTVTGTCDVDGDGERAVFTATKDQEATATTGSSVY
jgi:type II secretory pathway pseudopilin PulG